MNNIDTILQSADLPELPVETLSDERQAKILSGAMQLVRQDAKKRSRRRVVRIVAAAAAAIAVLCGAAAIWHYASVSNEESTYHAEGVVIRTDGTPNPYSYDFSHDAIIRVDTEGRATGTYCGMKFDWLPVLPPSDNTSTLYGSVSYRNPEQLEGISDSQKRRWKTASIIHGAKAPAHHFQLHACPQMRLQAAICWFSETIRKSRRRECSTGCMQVGSRPRTKPTPMLHITISCSMTPKSFVWYF